MKKYFWQPLLSIILLNVFMLTTAWADKPGQTNLPDPIAVAQDISNQMLAEMKKEKITENSPLEKSYKIVNHVLLPHADLPLMARLALGRDAWQKSTPNEQSDFIKAFTQLMVRTYASGMAYYVEQKFMPIRGGVKPGQTRVEINSSIVRKNGPNVPVLYRVIYSNDNGGAYQWLLYDFSVEGVSMIQSFRSQFSAKLSAGMSVAELTKELIQHNKAPLTKSKRA